MSDTVPCGAPATTAALWATGQRLVLCDECYRKAVGITQAMGFPLIVDHLDEHETTCTQKVRTPKEHP